MSRNINFSSTAWTDYVSYANDKKFTKKVQRLVKDLSRGNERVGKAEQLKHEAGSSMRIDQKNRLVYKLTDETLFIYAVGGHYNDH